MLLVFEIYTDDDRRWKYILKYRYFGINTQCIQDTENISGILDLYYQNFEK